MEVPTLLLEFASAALLGRPRYAVNLTIREMQAAIPKLKRRMEELEKFDPASVEDRSEAKVKQLEAAVDDTLKRVSIPVMRFLRPVAQPPADCRNREPFFAQRECRRRKRAFVQACPAGRYLDCGRCGTSRLTTGWHDLAPGRRHAEPVRFQAEPDSYRAV